jgi:L-cysteate sulfo-lyase
MKIVLPRFTLGHFPTPLEALPRVSRHLGGPEIWVKRDDLTALAGGGNKVRKLEFVVAAALAEGADTLVTLGGAQSNHCRQTAGAACKAGLRCILVLQGEPPAERTGNVLLDYMLGADVRWSLSRSREEVMAVVVASERKAGCHPWPIPLGASNALGAVGFAAAFEELMNQGGASFSRILFASSSGGTHAGLVAGAHGVRYGGEVLGISIDEELAALQRNVASIASATARLIGSPREFAPGDIMANADYLGGGYGVMGEPEREAIDLFARYEGLLLDPVYTARAAAGMIDLIRRRKIGKDEKILFWHTGGIPALWAYSGQFVF